MNLDVFYTTVRDRSYIHDLPLSVKTIDDALENYPSHFVSTEQFRRLVRNSGKDPSMACLSDTYRKYGIAWASSPLDHFVAESMKVYDREMYDGLKGYTKTPRLGRALHTLLKFAKPLKTSKNVRSDPLVHSAYLEALQDVRSLFKDMKFDTLPLADMFKQLPVNTSAGFPYYRQKSDVLDDCRQATTENYFRLLNGKKIEQRPCLLALRGHVSELSRIKTRPIWINSFDNVALENILFRNVYDYVFNDPDFNNLIMTGPATIKRLRDYLSAPSRLSFCNLDYSAWDAWRCRFAARDLFKVFRSVLNLKEGEGSVFDYVEKQFLDSILVLPDGSAYRKRAGTPSGSLLTALFNSLLNYLVLRTCFRFHGVTHCVELLRVLGDDAAFNIGVSDPRGFIEKMAAFVDHYFGLTLNPDKCLVTDHHAPVESRKFIGYSLRNDQLYRPVEEFFRYLLYVERPVEDIRTSFSRVVSYLLLGGIYHHEFCAFVEAYLGHYQHLLSTQSNLADLSVFKFGNLRVIKHVFQMELDSFFGEGISLESFRSWDFLSLPFRFTLGHNAPLRE